MLILYQRKLPWTSTLQASLTLALVNPVLWYLIDRSKPGFLLSAAVGLVGTTVLLGLNPEMMPSPATLVHPTSTLNATNSLANETLGGLVTKQTVECGTWFISVLFCSCVCFGNIGRRLALKKAPHEKRRRSSFI
jgi:Insulin-induced protein (INSIG)